MPNLTGLAALFRLRPDRAADYLAAKGYKLSGPYWEMDGPQHSHLFTVANLAKLDVLQDIRGAVQKALDEGQTQRWFEKQLIDTLKAKGWWGGKDGSLRRLQTIYRTNLQTAYMAGRHQQAMEQADRRPWAQYIAVLDQRTRPAHAALHGHVFRIDSPAWSVVAPSNSYNCRCRARYLSDRDLEKRGLKPAEDIQILEREPPGKVPVNPMTGATPQRWIQRGVSVPSKTKPGERDILWADPGWDNIPGSDGAERMLVDRLMAKATDLGDGIKMAVQAGLQEVAAVAEVAPVAVASLPLNHPFMATQPGISEEVLAKKLAEVGGERMDSLRQFVEKRQLKSLFLTTSESKMGSVAWKQINDEVTAFLTPGPGLPYYTSKSKAYGYTSQSWRHVVIRANKTLNLSKATDLSIKKSVAIAIENYKEFLIQGGLKKTKTWTFSSVNHSTDSASEAVGTWLHEIGHQVHYAAGAPNKPKSFASITRYGETNAGNILDAEWHAEHWAAWFIDRDALAAFDINIATYFDRLMKQAIENGR